MTDQIDTLTPLLAGGLALLWIGHRVLYPYKACRVCGGTGRLRGGFGSIALCRHCDGGVIPRLTTRLWRAHRDRNRR